MHKLSYLNIPLDQCSKAQLIECIEGLDRNLQAARSERDQYERKWQKAAKEHSYEWYPAQ